ncbi:cytochrome c peroxidase [Chitinophaga niabensis]|uniref:cytochrome-c peroxidase n=1 Tax=Chitinophaga niabensis TaxID=536979 RepID=UPI0031BAD908
MSAQTVKRAHVYFCHMVTIKRLLLPGFCLFILMSLTNATGPSIGVEATVQYFRSGAKDFAASTLALQSTIHSLRKDDTASVAAAKAQLKHCRLQYKKIEFFLEYFFKTSSLIYNTPAKVEIEEPYMEYNEPVGLQVIEALLYEDDVVANKAALLEQVNVVRSSAEDLLSLLYGFTANDKQVLESVRIELIRIYTLGITGFDAPLLKSGITESYEALHAVKAVLAPYLDKRAPYADSVTYYLAKSLQFLEAGKDFDAFDRLRFLQQYALPLQRTLGYMIRDMQLVQNTTGGVLNYNAEHLFSKDAINIDAFPAAGNEKFNSVETFPLSGVAATPALYKFNSPDAFTSTGATVNTALISLGKKLFHETALSGNNKISCATCHRPEKHFTDGLATSMAFDGHSHVRRNAPSLFYAGFQYGQFWEGRIKSLEEQALDVVHNPLEMNGDAAKVLQLPAYTALFKQVFPDSSITAEKVAVAIAAFVRSLNPRNAPFDRYITGDTTAMNTAQVRGFNLFMGKAQCGTCHFAPLFNGLVPPLYNLTELEVLGTPRNEDLAKPLIDGDKGRYDVLNISFYEQAFKTPTVRNVSATGPYMHNGAFSTLENVVEFYNKGGGSGIGLETPTQTLSAVPLQLTKQEVADVTEFMRALEDKLP